MCGIFGHTRIEKADLEKSRKALHSLAHRGPDQWNDYIDENVYLGHRRLSILDLSENGKQPFSDEKSGVYVTVNGEIYNYKALRNELKGQYSFQSDSDSEVVLFGFIAWGIDSLLEKIDGMYAITIYDKHRKCVYLVRDRVGIKPLHYSKFEKDFIWASEIKAIQSFVGEDNLEKDLTALYDFYTYQYIPAPKTLYKDIFKIKPAHYLKIDLMNGQETHHHYWELGIQQHSTSIKEAKENIYQLVKESINEQMISDVPVGFFLSGGMDSSVVVALAAKQASKISTFNIGFKNNPKDESHFALLVAKKFNTTHHKKVLDTVQMDAMFNRIKEWFDEPFADLSCFPTYLVSEFAKQNVTVVLTGDGGDEVFSGYKWYKAFELFNKYNLRRFQAIQKPLQFSFKSLTFLPPLKKHQHRIKWLFLDELELYTKLMGGFIKEEKKDLAQKLSIPDDYDDYWYFRKYYKQELSVYHRLRYLDFHTYLPDDILTKVDRVSMAVSLECRVPFLSKAIIEYVFTLPDSIVLYQNQLKGIMKAAFKDTIPNAITNRPKEGFNLPSGTWGKNIRAGYNSRFDRIVREVFNINI